MANVLEKEKPIDKLLAFSDELYLIVMLVMVAVFGAYVLLRGIVELIQLLGGD